MDFTSLENTILAGRFRLEDELGRGGFGAVFAAEQISVGRRCAVKLLATNDNTDTLRFKNEARATSQLTHPNTVTIFDFGEDDETGLLFLAMEYLDGESLRQRIKRDGPLTMGETVHIVNQVAASLAEAHKEKIVHRDVKPHNIMLAPRDEDPLFVKVIDFGIAKAFEAQNVSDGIKKGITQTGTIIGTPAYMSTEQIEQQEMDGRSDQYALACVIFTMLSGKPPFQGSSPIGIATRHLTDPVPLITDRVDVPKAVDGVLARAMSKKPDGRYRSILEFAQAFEEAADTTDKRPADAITLPRRQPESERETVVNPSARNALIGAVFLVAVGAISLAGALFVKSKKETDPQPSVVETVEDSTPTAPVEEPVKEENDAAIQHATTRGAEVAGAFDRNARALSETNREKRPTEKSVAVKPPTRVTEKTVIAKKKETEEKEEKTRPVEVKPKEEPLPKEETKKPGLWGME